MFRTTLSAFRAAKLVAVFLVSFGLVGAACATWDTSDIDSPPSTTEKVYEATEAGITEAFFDLLSANTDSLSDWGAPAEEAECGAEKLVSRFGVERLVALGFDPEEPSLALNYEGPEIASATNILDGCLNMEDGMLSIISSYSKLSLGSAECLSLNFERAGLNRSFVSGLVTGEEPDPFALDGELGRQMARIAGDCLDDTELLPNAPLAPIPESGQPQTTVTSLVDPDATTTTIDDLLVIEDN